MIPPCRSFLLPVFLAEFPSGVWVPAMSTYLPWLTSPREKEPKEGHLPIFKWRRWPNVDGANSCLGILLVSHVNQVIQPLFLSYYFWPNSHLVHGYPPSLLILPGLLRSVLGGASVPPLLQENGKTPAAYIGGDCYSMQTKYSASFSLLIF